MNNKVKMVVFDMAGTTIDEDNVVYKTIYKVLAHDYPKMKYEEVLKIAAGKEKLKAIQDVLVFYNLNVEESIIKDYYNLFNLELVESYYDLSVKPILGAEEVISKLRKNNIIVVLNTGYSREIAVLLLQKLNWVEGTHYDLLVTATDVEKGRPNPDMIFLASKHFKIPTGNIVKVGDTSIDVEEGKNAGCLYSIGITGAFTETQLKESKPDYIINGLSELKGLLV